ncbi:MAG: surface lipoprotein assembly modifier [Novosphingobium sp.]
MGATPVAAQDSPAAATTVSLTPAQLFDFAGQAQARGDIAAAEAAYRALATNPDIEIRTEARFRLAMMLADQKRYADAAIELRKILDEKPKAARVRLELARMDALLGRPGDAARELRAAQAAGLPPEVQQVVRFYTSALEDQKPFGYSLGLSIAPDTNINRATKSDTLGTIIGDFTLDQNAKAQSGVGLALQGQAYGRLGIDPKTRLLVSLSGQGSLYRQSQFNDVIVALQAGPERAVGAGRVNLNAAVSARWYGGSPFSRTYGGSTSWRHPWGKKAQIRLGGAAAYTDNLQNDLQDGMTYSLSADYDRAFSARFGGGVQLGGSRSAARDPGYATTSGNANFYLFREFGSITGVINLGYGHLETDRRLFLYPRRRIEDRYSAGLALTLRSFHLGQFAPLARIGFERNKSTIEIYDYTRFSGELGITASF